MKPIIISRVLCEVDDDIIQDAESLFCRTETVSTSIKSRERKGGYRKPRAVWLKVGFAACLLCAITLSAAIALPYVAQAQEYVVAIAFFNENDLPTDGLSRVEIIEVYRDIYTSTFTHDKTAQVIMGFAGGYEIFQETPTTEELKVLWNNRDHPLIPDSDSIVVDNRRIVVESDGNWLEPENAKMTVAKYDGETKIWSTVIPGFESSIHIDSLEKCSVFYEDYTLLYGASYVPRPKDFAYPQIVLFDKDGKVIWSWDSKKDVTPAEYSGEWISKIICDENGFTVFGENYVTKDVHKIAVTRFDYHGNLIYRKLTALQEISTECIDVVTLSDGYLMYREGFQEGNKSTNYFIMINADGSFGDNFNLATDNSDYFVTDVIEYGDNIMISTFSYPKEDTAAWQSAGYYWGVHCGDYWPEEGWKQRWTEEHATEYERLFMENYRAVLFMVDKAGNPQTFYTIPKSQGAKLCIDNQGNLLWQADTLSEAKFYMGEDRPYCTDGRYLVYQYTFDSYGGLTEQSILYEQHFKDYTGWIDPIRDYRQD